MMTVCMYAVVNVAFRPAAGSHRSAQVCVNDLRWVGLHSSTAMRLQIKLR